MSSKEDCLGKITTTVGPNDTTATFGCSACPEATVSSDGIVGSPRLATDRATAQAAVRARCPKRRPMRL